MIRRREKKKKEFSLIISLESLINQSVWGWAGILSVTIPPLPICHLLENDTRDIMQNTVKIETGYFRCHRWKNEFCLILAADHARKKNMHKIA